MNSRYAPEKSVPVPPFGRVDLSPYLPIIDHRLFQLLKYKTQLSLVKEVFPGATHTRYTHSLGVMHVAQRLLRAMVDRGFFEGDDRVNLDRNASVAGLVHDIGHPPYSHIAEYVLAEHSRQNHEGRTRDLINTELKESLVRVGASPDIVCDMLDKSKNTPGRIITSRGLGADKIAYLVQDAHMVGYDETYPPNWENLCMYVGWDERGMFIEEKAVSIIKPFQQFYFDMYTKVYLRKKALGAGRMLQKALELHLAGTDIDPGTVWDMPESMVDTMLATSPVRGAQSLAQNLARRDLPKSAVVFKFPQYVACERIAHKSIEVCPLPEEAVATFLQRFSRPSSLSALESQIAREVGLEPHQLVMTTISEWHRLIPEDLLMVDNHGNSIGSLFQRYPDFNKSLVEGAKSWYGVHVMVPQEERERVAGAARAIQQIVESAILE